MFPPHMSAVFFQSLQTDQETFATKIGMWCSSPPQAIYLFKITSQIIRVLNFRWEPHRMFLWITGPQPNLTYKSFWVRDHLVSPEERIEKVAGESFFRTVTSPWSWMLCSCWSPLHGLSGCSEQSVPRRGEIHSFRTSVFPCTLGNKMITSRAILSSFYWTSWQIKTFQIWKEHWGYCHSLSQPLS